MQCKSHTPKHARTRLLVRLFEAGITSFEELEAAAADAEWLAGPGAVAGLRGERLHAVRARRRRDGLQYH